MYERLIRNGIKPLVAMSAVMRKLIVTSTPKSTDAEMTTKTW
jgi:hypothetical protein